MDNEFIAGVMGFFLGAALTALFGLTAMQAYSTDAVQKQAVAHGVAEYKDENGSLKFVWKGSK